MQRPAPRPGAAAKGGPRRNRNAFVGNKDATISENNEVVHDGPSASPDALAQNPQETPANGRARVPSEYGRTRALSALKRQNTAKTITEDSAQKLEIMMLQRALMQREADLLVEEGQQTFNAADRSVAATIADLNIRRTSSAKASEQLVEHDKRRQEEAEIDDMKMQLSRMMMDEGQRLEQQAVERRKAVGLDGGADEADDYLLVGGFDRLRRSLERRNEAEATQTKLLRKWAFKFDDGTLRRYTLEQIGSEFEGVDEVSVGMEVHHKTRGRGTAITDFVETDDDELSIAELRAQHAETVARLEMRHAVAVSKLEGQLATTVQDHTDQVSKLEARLSESMHRHQSTISTLEGKVAVASASPEERQARWNLKPLLSTIRAAKGFSAAQDGGADGAEQAEKTMAELQMEVAVLQDKLVRRSVPADPLEPQSEAVLPERTYTEAEVRALKDSMKETLEDERDVMRDTIVMFGRKCEETQRELWNLKASLHEGKRGGHGDDFFSSVFRVFGSSGSRLSQ